MVFFTLYLVDVNVVVVATDSQMTLIRGVLCDFTVVLGVFERCNFLVEVIQQSYTDFTEIVANDQVVVSHACCHCTRLLVRGQFGHS